ncbi:hypothetical protein DAPPUDRAFT_315762 [Daphnia pulex]|uniref:Uncharacterized protein n=1 Tax=Daphnia pulex TaxID=6669 RepID=E9GAR6_DAPPU|nr:hypothetical protein DAPPUDRAFT_315762 [Daphnia pulex]|eukprot:EFX83303.1 hypothetical protein DAPPUDRAFT_315762 [Daphnia pulex]
MKTFVIVALVVTLVMVGALANPVAPVAADEETDDDGHDLETAESLLEIIEKKIAKLIQKCVKHGGCQSFYSQPYYSHSSDYGYGSSSYGGYGSSHVSGYAPSYGGGY